MVSSWLWGSGEVHELIHGWLVHESGIRHFAQVTVSCRFLLTICAWFFAESNLIIIMTKAGCIALGMRSSVPESHVSDVNVDKRHSLHELFRSCDYKVMRQDMQSFEIACLWGDEAQALRCLEIWHELARTAEPIRLIRHPNEDF